MRTLRLTAKDTERARPLFALMAHVFGEECEPLSDEHLGRLLSRDDFWAIAAALIPHIGLATDTITLPHAWPIKEMRSLPNAPHVCQLSQRIGARGSGA